MSEGTLLKTNGHSSKQLFKQQYKRFQPKQPQLVLTNHGLLANATNYARKQNVFKNEQTKNMSTDWDRYNDALHSKITQKSVKQLMINF